MGQSWFYRIGRLICLYSILAMTLAVLPSLATARDNQGLNENESLGLEIGGGTMLRLPKAAKAIYVANPDIADVQLRSPQLMHLFGKTVGETVVHVVGQGDEILLQRRIVVGLNLTRMREMMQLVRPKERIQVESFANSILLAGVVSNAEAAADFAGLAASVVGEDGQVINRLQIASPSQVNLRVRIAEVSRDISKQLGFSWNLIKQAGEFTVGLATGGFSGLAAATGASLFSVEDSGGSLNVNSLIDALDDQGLITVLAEPNLTAMSGESANFLAGGEFPIPVPGDDGTITIAFKQFGVGLGFFPVVLSDGQLHIKVRAEVSQLSEAGAISFNGFEIPALTTRQAETTVKLGSGQSFAIAGLLQNTTNQGVNRVPGLGELPVLGGLFRSNSFQRQESELVVIVTPYLVRPVSGPMVAPTDGFQPASDFNRNFKGAMTEGRSSEGERAPIGPDGAQETSGLVGFVLR